MEINEAKLIEYMKQLDEAVAQSCISYIQLQLNSDSLNGFINDFEYRMLLDTALEGLFELLYISYYELDPTKKDVMYNAAENLTVLYFTQVRNGLKRDFELKRAEASRPIVGK